MHPLRAFIRRRFERGGRYGLELTLAFALITTALWIFLQIVGAAVTTNDVAYVDSRVQELMAGWLTPRLTALLVLVTYFGGIPATAVGVVVAGLLLLHSRRWWSLFGLVLATGGGGLVVFGLKVFFGRARPVEQVIETGGLAFPSGHAFAATVFFGYVTYLVWKHLRNRVLQLLSTIGCLLLVLLIGTSRVYLGVHWLTDVLGGYLAGTAWLVMSILIVRHAEWKARETTG